MRTTNLTAVMALMIVGLASSELAMAEVGIAPGPSASPTSGLYKLAIIDDGEPIGTAWHRFTSDPSRVVLNPEGEANGDGEPSFVFNRVSGLPIVAWARNSAQGFDVVVSVFTNGVWSAPSVVAGSPANELDPDVFLDPAGNIHLVYWVANGVNQTVFHVEAPSDASSWSAPEQVSAPGEAACRAVGIVHGGVVRVAYEVHAGGYGTAPRNVVLARNDGSGFVPEVIAVTNNTSDVRPSVHCHSGELWVDWVDAHGVTEFEGETAWVRLAGNGSWEPIRYEPFTSRLERDLTVRATIRLEAVGP